ncbi:MAG: isocitrate/isopropylmalate dehydrogenase family protein [Candidatus Methylacidiphilales bacterium]|nr:isocitrate/isopropylmalate family dehydrogenase [Candidatus Methylacidiphilales bacterium]
MSTIDTVPASAKRIALYPGDGIGQEVTAATVTLLNALAAKGGEARLEFTQYDWGVDYHTRYGKVMPDDFLDVLRPYDAVYLGAVGFPARLPDHVTLVPLIRMRQAFDQYACVRPARTFTGVPQPLAGQRVIDMIVLRENSEGEYIDNGGRFRKGTPEEVAVQTAIHSRRGIERILRFGFELARTRRRHLTMITKSNAQKYSYVLWDEVLEQLAPEYSDVAADKEHIDAAAMNFVRRPEFYDIVVSSNLFGDILSDLSGGITGGLGLNPSANLNPTRAFPSLFEPVHGSAPDIAGQGIANPIGAILSAAMMLDWLDFPNDAARIRTAVDVTLAAGQTTRDLGGKLSTTQAAQAVIQHL